MKRFIIALVTLVWAGAAAAQTLLSPSEFREAVAARIHTLKPDLHITNRDDLGVTVTAPDAVNGDGTQINLDRGYAEYQADPSRLTALIEQWSHMATDPPTRGGAEALVVILRTADTVAAYQHLVSSAPHPATIMSRPFAGDLVEVLAFDSAQAVGYATDADLRDLHLSADDAWGIAETDTPRHRGGLNLSFIEGVPTMAEVDGGNGLAPSHLAEPGFCAEPLANQHTYLVVDRGVYVFADADNPHDFAQFLAITGDAIARGQSLSHSYLRCDRGHVVEWSPDQNRT